MCKVQPKNNQVQRGSNKSSSPISLWTIHGQEYDLRRYVDQHPGGKTAINLGKGRDCSALFESYHPFTSAHKSVLEKYKVKREGEEATKCQQRPDDDFYDTLKLRVSKALKDKGIDPKHAGCASLSRVVYLCFVFFCFTASAILHAQVSKKHALCSSICSCVWS